jgi:hypothetical protein
VEVITGTTVEEDFLDSRANNYLVSIGKSGEAEPGLRGRLHRVYA